MSNVLNIRNDDDEWFARITDGYIHLYVILQTWNMLMMSEMSCFAIRERRKINNDSIYDPNIELLPALRRPNRVSLYIEF